MTSDSPRHQHQIGSAFRSRVASPGDRRLSRLLGLALIIASLSPSVRGQVSVTLAWDPSPGSGIAGYRLYQGAASRVYTRVINLGALTSQTVSGLISGVTYFFAVTAYNTNGLEGDFSDEISYTVPWSPNHPSTNALTFAADSGTISLPFIAADGTVYQAVQTDLGSGGRAVYSFNIPRAGSYVVCAMVSAPSEAENSFFVNMDAEPTDPLMIWDIPVCATLTRHTVAWRGNGNGNPDSSQYSPKVFSLSAGAHQLIIRGREANTRLGSISIAAAPPELRIRTVPDGSVILTGTGQPGQTYKVRCSTNLRSWTVIGTVTIDGSGSFQFSDPAAQSRPRRMYRLERITVTPPRLQIYAAAGGPVILDATGESGQTYTVLCSEGLRAWSVIGTLMLDANGWGQFTDLTGTSRPNRMYRLQGQ